jgi:hypothetical protein
MNQNRKATAPSVAAFTQPEAFAALRTLIAKTFIYKGGKLEVLEVSEETESKFAIICGAKTVYVTVENTRDFIGELYAVENVMPVAAIQQQAIQPASRQEGMIDDMTEDLYEVFKNLKAKPTRENIEIATAMSNTANTAANMMKLKLQVLKLQGKGR